MLVRRERTHVEVRRRLIPDLVVARNADVVIGYEGEPDEIVGETRPHAAPARLVPPVLDVALAELMRCRAQDMRSRHRRFAVDECHSVLQLVAESKRTAGLVDRGPRPHATGKRLIERPAVDERIELRGGRSNVNRAQSRGPRIDRLLRVLLRERRCAILGDERADLVASSRSAQEHHDLARFAGCKGDAAAQCGARIKAGAEGARQCLVLQCRRRREIAVAAEKRRSIPGCARHLFADPRERQLRSEIFAKAVLGEYGAGFRIAPSVHLMTRVLALGAQCPLHVRREHESPRCRALVANGEAGELHRVVRRNGECELGRDAVARVREGGQTRRVHHVIRRRTEFVARGIRTGGGAPHLTRLRVPEKNRFAGRIADGVVEPGGEAIEVAVLHPGESTTALGDAEPNIAVGDDVRPWTWRDVTAVHVDVVVERLRHPTKAVPLRRRHGSADGCRRHELG